MDEASSDLAAVLAAEFNVWFRNLGAQGVLLQRAFTGVTKEGKQGIIILSGLPLNHVQHRDFLIWLCRTEQFVAYAYGTHVGIADTPSTISDAIAIYASSHRYDVSKTLGIERTTDAIYRFSDRDLAVAPAGSNFEIFLGLHRSPDNISDDDQELFFNLWTDVKPKAMWRQR
jgi:hypothetical protein